MYLYLTLPAQSSWFLSDMRGPPEETSLGISSCLFQRLWSPACLEARSPDTAQLLPLVRVPSLMTAVPIQPPVPACWQRTWPGDTMRPKCSPQSSQVLSAHISALTLACGGWYLPHLKWYTLVSNYKLWAAVPTSDIHFSGPCLS